jgi:hypothetical protein
LAAWLAKIADVAIAKTITDIHRFAQRLNMVLLVLPVQLLPSTSLERWQKFLPAQLAGSADVAMPESFTDMDRFAQKVDTH